MEITLEKIELVKDRTGVSYKEAKDALEAADGSVVDAIISIEESVDYEAASSTKASQDIIASIKKTIAKGHMSKIVVKKGEDVILNLPLTAGVLGAVIAPWGAIIAMVAAAGTKCVVEFVNDKGETTDINGKVMDKYGKAKEKGQAVYGKGQQTYDKIKESNIYGDIKAKREETVDRIKESDLFADIKAKSEEVVADIKARSEEVVAELNKIKEEGFDNQKFMDNLDELRKKGEESLEELRKKGEEILKKANDGEDAFLYEFEDDNVEMTFGEEEGADIAVDNVVDAFADAVADVTGGHTTLEETVEDLAAASNDEVSADEIEDLARILDEVEKESGLTD